MEIEHTDVDKKQVQIVCRSCGKGLDGSWSRYVEVKWDYVDFHKYEDAPEEVAFLKNLHRHKFYATAKIEVFHEDRELEFFMVLNKIETEIMPFMYLGDQISSCEQQAEFILIGLQNLYGLDRFIKVKISEDRENAGIVQWDPRKE